MLLIVARLHLVGGAVGGNLPVPKHHVGACCKGAACHIIWHKVRLTTDMAVGHVLEHTCPPTHVLQCLVDGGFAGLLVHARQEPYHQLGVPEHSRRQSQLWSLLL